MRLNYTSLNRSPTSLSYLLSSGFKPASLFAQSEPGVWLDPSDVADLAWRRNLLTFTEQFDNAAWGKNDTTVTPNAVIAPDGTLTAEKFTPGTIFTQHVVEQPPTLQPASGPVSLSAYFKASELTKVVVRTFDDVTLRQALFNLSTGLVETGSGTVAEGLATIENVGNGWYRCSLLAGTTKGSALKCSFRLCPSSTPASDPGASWSGNNLDGGFIWGAQLELGSTATPYQRISDVTTEVLERFPTTTLFQDTTGTTPVTTPGQPVGLVLDKSKGLVLGPELVTNGDFSGGSTGWSVNGGWSISGGAANAAIASGFGDVRGNSNLTTIGRTYRLTFTLNVVSGGVRWYLGGVTASTTITSSGTYSVLVLATDVQYVAFIAYGSGGAFTGSVDNISVREIPGNHATQATSASRPTYGIEPLGGRRNLLEQTEEFNNAYWTKTSATVTPDSDGTADLLYPSTSGTARGIERTVGAVSSTPYTTSIEAKAAGLNFLYLYGAQGNVVAYFNLSTGAIGTVGSGLTATITDVGSGYYRCSVTQTVTTRYVYAGGCDANGSTQATASGTNGILIRKAQLEASATATAYQRVGTAFDVTEAGIASVSYLSFDGVDDWLVTPTITPGTDKAQVFAGLRKLSDTNAACLLELGSSISLNARTFGLFAPGTNGSADYYFGTRGTVLQNLQTSTVYPAPISNVVTAISDISGDIARLHVNGTQAVQNTGDQGTGNFDSYPLYIGRRAGTSLPFNGQIYSLIVRFGTNLATDQIASIESSVGSKTGFFAPTITGVPTIGVS